MDEVVRGVPHSEKLFIGGDFNGYIGSTTTVLMVCMEVLVLGLEIEEELRFWILLNLLSW